MQKRILLVLLSGFIFLINPRATKAQRVYDNPNACPSGTQPNIPKGVNYNPLTGNYKIAECIDQFGNISLVPVNITGVNTGVFTNSQVNEYFQVQIGANAVTEWTSNYGSSKTTDAFSSAIKCPVGSTVFACQAIAGYIRQQNGGPTTSAVSIYGQCIADTNPNGTCTGIGSVASDVPGISNNALYGAQLGGNVSNTTSVLRGVLINSTFQVQPTGSMGIEISPPTSASCPTCVWPMGIRFDTAATKTPDSNNGAIFLFPIASGVNQPSQGISFIANAPVSGTVQQGFTLLPSGAFNGGLVNSWSYFRSGGNPGFPDIFGNGSAPVVIGDANGALFPNGLKNTASSTVALLPTCNASSQDTWRVVTDASAPTYNGTLTGGGAVRVPVYCNGTAWTSH